LSSFFQGQLDYIYFFYGLAFILLASVCLFLQRSKPRRLPWIWLGLFGLIHGIGEWLDMFAISLGDSVSFRVVRLVLFVSSFLCLVEFGRQGFNRLYNRKIGLWIYLPFGMLAISGAIAGLMEINVTARYGLALTGGLLVALVLMHASKTADRAGSFQRYAGITTAIYAVAAGVIVPLAPFFPASLINQTVFASQAGIPIQLIRGTVAIVLTALVWSYYRRSRADVEYTTAENKAIGTKLIMIFVAVLLAGWVFTEVFGDKNAEMMRQDMTHQTSIASETVDAFAEDYVNAGENPGNPDYAEVQKRLGEVQEANSQIRGAELLKFDGLGNAQVLTSTGVVPGLTSGEGEFDEAAARSTEDLKPLFATGKPMTLGPYSDSSGSYLTSYAPVHNPETGQTIAAIRIDFDAVPYENAIGVSRLIPISITLLISLIVIGAYVTRQSLAEKAETLENAKRRFSDLTHKAIMERHWEVGFEDNFVPTCWEKKSCTKTGCPVYGKQHARCWLIAGTYCRGDVQGRFAQKLGDCSRCEVYQEALTHGPVSEIGENFNSLMWSLREKEDMLKEANAELESQNDELKELHRLAKERANTDGLTGLKNHGHFQRRLQKEVERAERYGRSLSLVMIDLDNFKLVNDKFGHQKGDAILKQVGRILSTEIREIDYAARYGGEEFAVIMPEITGPEAVEAADRLRRKFEQLYKKVEIPEYHTAASFGVADFPACAQDNNSLIAAADGALLFAKRQGRNRVAYFRDLSQAELSSDDIDSLNHRLEGTGFHTIRVLAAAVDARDQYDDGRNDMSRVAAALAGKLNFSDDQREALELASRLHDIGKIGIPREILQKKEKLRPEEVELLRKHPQVGEQMLKEAAQIKDLISAVLYHHERWDGKGYPEGLRSDDIPILARVVGILDAYRAMLSDRPYRKALSVDAAIEELRKGAGSQFDPNLVELFTQCVRESNGRGLRRVC